MFSSISGTYDLLNALLSAGLDRRWRRRALELAEADGARRVLDLGTGTGDLALQLLRRPGFRGRIVGVDFSGEMLRLAHEKCVGDRDRLRLIQGDALLPPFRDDAFDLIMGAFSVRNLSDLGAGLTACRRLLSPQGRMLILEFFRPDRVAWPLRTYIRHVLPPLGRLVSRHASAYAYLRDSQEAFVSLEEARPMWEASGFREVRVERLFPGVAHAVLLRRP